MIVDLYFKDPKDESSGFKSVDLENAFQSLLEQFDAEDSFTGDKNDFLDIKNYFMNDLELGREGIIESECGTQAYLSEWFAPVDSKEEPFRCPCCGSHNLSAGSMETDIGIAWRDAECNACGESWSENFTFSGLDVDSDNDWVAYEVAKATEKKNKPVIYLVDTLNELMMFSGEEFVTSSFTGTELEVPHLAIINMAERESKLTGASIEHSTFTGDIEYWEYDELGKVFKELGIIG